MILRVLHLDHVECRHGETRAVDDAADLAVERDQLVTERQGWEKRARQLRTNSLDPDMLEERVRRVLNFTRPNEYVVMTNDSLTQ